MFTEYSLSVQVFTGGSMVVLWGFAGVSHEVHSAGSQCSIHLTGLTRTRDSLCHNFFLFIA